MCCSPCPKDSIATSVHVLLKVYLHEQIFVLHFTIGALTLVQALSASSEEGCSLFPDEANSSGERRQWEDHSDPAADEVQTFPFLL